MLKNEDVRPLSCQDGTESRLGETPRVLESESAPSTRSFDKAGSGVSGKGVLVCTCTPSTFEQRMAVACAITGGVVRFPAST